MSFPQNSVVLDSLQDVFDQTPALFAQYKTFIDSNSTFPMLKPMVNMDDKNVLNTNQARPVPLKKIIDILASNKASYLNPEDYAMEQSKINNWFKYNNLALGITFIMSVLGILSFGLFCVTCVQNMSTRSLVATAVAATGSVLPVGKAHELNDHEIIKEDMSYKGYILLSALITYLSFKILKKLYNTFIVYRFNIPVRGSPSKTHKTQLFIQLLSNDEQCLIHLAHIPLND